MLDPAPSAVHGPADLLATIPYVLGYHPHESIVVVFVTSDGRLTCGLRVDRQAPDTFIIAESSTAASRAGADRAFVVGYGPQSDRDRLAGLADSLNMAVTVQACLLVDDGRYYCLNDECPCTPEHGAALDLSSTVIAAKTTLSGRVALPSRADYDAFIAPDTDAQARTAAALNQVPNLLADPVTVMHTSLDTASAGGQLSDEQAAHLAVALQDNDGRNAAWLATTGETWQHDLWLDLVRRVPEHCVAAPANLVAWNAWRRNEPALAWAALSKAVHALPDNTMSHLVGRRAHRRDQSGDAALAAARRHRPQGHLPVAPRLRCLSAVGAETPQTGRALVRPPIPPSGAGHRCVLELRSSRCALPPAAGMAALRRHGRSPAFDSFKEIASWKTSHPRMSRITTRSPMFPSRWTRWRTRSHRST